MIKIDRDLINDEVSQILFVESRKISFKRNDIVIKPGKTCDFLFLIEKGMLRSFYHDRKGNDITNWFAKEEMMITSSQSFFKRTPSFSGIEAIEDTLVWAITYDQLQNGFEKSKSLERFVRLAVTEIMLEVGKKAISLQIKNAEERYRDLINHYPDIFQRAKLGHIAGYLGITQQSLSRIRANSF